MATRDERVAFVALIGAPNAGKSTLINALVGSKLAIVTPKVQTTRTSLRAIVTEGDTQLVVIDTPGIFQPKKRLDRAMVQQAWQSLEGVDCIAVVVDAAKGVYADTQRILRELKKRVSAESGPVVLLLLNKVDAVQKERLLTLVQECQALFACDAVFMIAAKTGDGVADVKQALIARARHEAWPYPHDQLCEAPERFLAAELTREQLFLQLQQELPYALTVETERWEAHEKGDAVTIHQVVYVEREGQKKILLGKNGARIKQVSQKARQEIGRLLGKAVHLFLFVKVRENWQDAPELYRDLGLEFPQE